MLLARFNLTVGPEGLVGPVGPVGPCVLSDTLVLSYFNCKHFFSQVFISQFFHWAFPLFFFRQVISTEFLQQFFHRSFWIWDLRLSDKIFLMMFFQRGFSTIFLTSVCNEFFVEIYKSIQCEFIFFLPIVNLDCHCCLFFHSFSFLYMLFN